MTATLHFISRLYTNQYNNIITQNFTHTNHSLITSSFIFFSPFCERTFQQPEKRKKKMALQIPIKSIPIPSSLAPTGNAGLRRPSDAYALKSSFSSPSIHLLLPARLRYTATKFSMLVASKQAYICRDCGYIYNDRTPFEKLPDGYFCPVCGAPKRRFRSYEPKVAKNANDASVRKARKEQIKKDEAVGSALPIAIVVGIVALAALYFYLNSTY